MIPLAVSDGELNLQKNNDLRAPGPYAEPDEFFLKRQRKALGE